MFARYQQYYRQIGRLALPLMVGQVGAIAVSFADNIMVGRYTTDALASASFVNNVFNIALFGCMGFAYGLTPLIGALFSGGKNDAIGRMLRTGLCINTVFMVVLAAVMTVVYFNLHRFGQPEHLLPYIRPYYLLVLAGMLPLMVFNVFSQWSYAINNTGLPTWIMLSANGLNVVGNYILIYGHWGAPELGLTGAGISTLIARFLGAIALCWVFFGTRMGAPYRKGFFRGERVKGQAGKVFRTGFPVAMQMTFETASFSGSAVIAGLLGTIPLAAFQVFAVCSTLGFCLYYSIGAAMAIPMSHAAGTGNHRAMRDIARAGYHLTLACMLLSMCIFIFFGRSIMGMFSSDEAVIAAAGALIVPIVMYQFGDATQINFANALRGTAHVMPMLWVAFVSYVLIGLPVTYLFAIPFGWGLYGIVLSFTVCLMLAGVLYLYFFMRATRLGNKEKMC